MRYCADLHGNTNLLKNFIEESEGGKGEEYLSVLGDAGINYYNDIKEYELKKELQSLIKKENKNIYILFVRGNHEIRPEDLETYEEMKMFQGKVYIEKEFPNLIFLTDGEIYTIEENRYLVLGGGYSRDAFSRVLNDTGYWSNEEISREEGFRILENLDRNLKDEISILSHMLPESASPLSGIDGGFTQTFLQKVMERYKKYIVSWHAGHYHKDIEWKQDEIRFCIHNRISKEM